MNYILKGLLTSSELSLYNNNDIIDNYTLKQGEIGLLKLEFKPTYTTIENKLVLNTPFYLVKEFKIYTKPVVIFEPQLQNNNFLYLIFIFDINKKINILNNKTKLLYNIKQNPIGAYIGLFNYKLNLIQEYYSEYSDIVFYCLTHTSLNINTQFFNSIFKYNNDHIYIINFFNELFENIDYVLLNNPNHITKVNNINIINNINQFIKNKNIQTKIIIKSFNLFT